MLAGSALKRIKAEGGSHARSVMYGAWDVRIE
jgi:hypothetical protein